MESEVNLPETEEGLRGEELETAMLIVLKEGDNWRET